MIRRLLARLSGTAEVPSDFQGNLDAEEQVLASGRTEDGPVVATHLGLWLPEARRVGWHLVSKATWRDGVLTLTEAAEIDDVGGAVLLRDQPIRRLRLTRPARLPDVVHERVNLSIRSRHHRDLPNGGAWVVQRKIPGRDGMTLQIRPDRDTSDAAARALAQAVVSRLGGE
ncbi:hypothetical protein GCM10009854_29590 [Saccharopolyspora halophila]|uniref:Uncharacterized protein n=1 Tax=Saccharopolyspora halophila TaxID=405551 RepID=A0ABN3GES1_9PSEU